LKRMATLSKREIRPLAYLRTFTFMWLALALWAGLEPIRAADPESPDPLAVGSKWEASVEVTAPDGSVQRGKAHRAIIGVESGRGTNYVVSVTQFSGLPGLGGFRTYRRRAEDGIHAINAADPEQIEYFETALPLETGRTWTASSRAGHTLFRVTGRESIKIGRREYKDCFRVEYDSTGAMPHGHFYLAPGIGNVSESFAVGGAKFRVTLDSFERGKTDTGPGSDKPAVVRASELKP